MWRSKSTADMPIPGPPITLFHHPLSPWARKVTTYLSFRGIPYREVHTSVQAPRPDLDALGVTYTRIPVMAIGRDIYCDTQLILEKLEELYPGSHLRGETGSEGALEKLLEKWTEVLVFNDAAQAVPVGNPILEDQEFSSNRHALPGKSWSNEQQARLRPSALANLRAHFDFLEDKVLADDGRWVHEDLNPGLADIHAAWVFDWLLEMPEALPANLFSVEKYPRTRVWRDRYRQAVSNAMERAPKPKKLEGVEAVREILESEFGEDDVVVDDEDPTGLKRGQKVDVFPTAAGDGQKDGGELVGLTVQEVVVGKKSKEGGKDIRIHCPRCNFTIEVAGAG